MPPNDRPAPTREEALFQAARQLEAGPARVAFLDQACAGDLALRQRLDTLLAADEQPDGALATSAEPARLRSQGSAPQAQPTLKLKSPAEGRDEAVGQTIDRYRLLENVGEGGCGVVYVAEQTEPIRRRVALKVIKLGMDTKAVIARFEAERQALAMMDHPNIARVLDAGTTETGRPYFVMELVRGIAITDYCDQNSLSTRERLDLFIQVCHAVQHAHQKGIIHRDIKPSNILVTLHDGVPVPKVIDFGIAKATEGRLTDATVYTQLHQFIGTPAYMSPEQAEMSGLDIDTRSDIYSLGVLLYELLTGRTPFDAEELMSQGIDAMRRTIREKDPLRPSTRLASLKGDELTTTAKRRALEGPRLILLLRGDLDWIAIKCLEKDRMRRYETANSLAADIQRHLEHEPVVARPPSTAYRVQKFVRRNKLMVGAAAALAAVMISGILVSTWQAIRATRAEKLAEDEWKKAVRAKESEAEQRAAAQEAERTAREQAYAANINLAHQAWQESNLGRVSDLLEETRPKAGEQDLRGWEWRYLWGLARGDDIRELARFEGQVWNLACSPNNGLVAVGLEGRTTEDRGGFIYDLASDRISNRREFATNSASVAVFVPHTGELLSNRRDARGSGISVLDATTLEETARLQTTNEVTFMVVSRDGRWLASIERIGLHVGTVAVWKTEDWSRCWSMELDGNGLRNGGRVEFLGDGRRLAVGNEKGNLTVYDTASGNALPGTHQVGFFEGYKDVIALAYLPASDLLAVGADYTDSTIRLYQPETGECVRELTNHMGWIADMEVSPDGQWLASASADQTVRLWDISSSNPGSWANVFTLRGHKDEVICLAFSPDGKRLLSGDNEGSVRLWAIPPVGRPRAIIDRCHSIRLSPDSQRMVSFLYGAHYFVWDLNTGEALGDLTAFTGRGGICEFSPDGRELLVGGSTGKIQVWNFERSSLREFDTGRTEPTQPFWTFPDRNLVLMMHYFAPREVYFTLWQFDPPQLMSVTAPQKAPYNGRLSSSGDLALVHNDGSLTLQRITPVLAPTNFWPHRRGINDVAFTPDGSVFATAGREGIARLWETASGSRIAELESYLLSNVSALEISPDGRLLATGGGGKKAVTLWGLQTHQELMSLPVRGWGCWEIVFSRDGNKLVGRSRLGDDKSCLNIWRAPSWEEISAAEAKEKAEARWR